MQLKLYPLTPNNGISILLISPPPTPSSSPFSPPSPIHPSILHSNSAEALPQKEMSSDHIHRYHTHTQTDTNSVSGFSCHILFRSPNTELPVETLLPSFTLDNWFAQNSRTLSGRTLSYCHNSYVDSKCWTNTRNRHIFIPVRSTPN